MGALADLLLGACTLTKPMVFSSIVVVALWIFAQRRSGRLRLPLVSIFLGSALMSLLPWTLHNGVNMENSFRLNQDRLTSYSLGRETRRLQQLKANVVRGN
jgi:4-amino-4-deoxy-L-arabinose transferase-like glycosyltransferase